MKRCTACDEPKPLDGFHRHKRNKDGRMDICADCNKAKVRAWRLANLDRVRETKRVYNAENREAITARRRVQRQTDPDVRKAHLEHSRRWASENPDKRRETQRRWEQANKAAIRERKLEARRANPEKARARMQRWRKANPHKVRIDNFMRRHRHFDAVAVDHVELLLNDPCSYCGAPVEHIDHITPLAGGGDNAWDNLTAACAACNQSKRARPLLEFLLDNQRPQRQAA